MTSRAAINRLRAVWDRLKRNRCATCKGHGLIVVAYDDYPIDVPSCPGCDRAGLVIEVQYEQAEPLPVLANRKKEAQ